MIGLSEEIRSALDSIIEGLNVDLFATRKVWDKDLEVEYEEYVYDLDDDKMKKVMASKSTSFNDAKDIMIDWMSSPNAPSKETVKYYIAALVESGHNAIDILRQGLREKIDYTELDPTKHDAAIAAKKIIYRSIRALNTSIIELEEKLQNEDFSLKELEFKVGYPERYARGDFFPLENYYKNWYNEKKDAVNICPFSTKGKTITISDLKIQLPKVPRDKSKVLFKDLPKEEQYWRRQDVPPNITPDNVDDWSDYIKEEFRRRREGVWFMNNGEYVYLTGRHYFALQWCKMLDNGEFMGFRYAQLHMFYHLEACIVDNRCLGQIFLKSRRTGFTYIVISILLDMATSKNNAKFGMTSKSGDDALEAFTKFSYMFLELPFYFRPVVKGKEDSLTELFFGKPSEMSKEAKLRRDTSTKDYLNTHVDWRPTKNDSYDSVKLDGYLGDEMAKWTKKAGDYIKHFGMVAPTMMPGGRIVGKAFLGSTMGAHEQGGEQMQELYLASKIDKRDPVTQRTPTSLYAHFLPAQENMEEYTDKYGKCWQTTPPTKVYNVYGRQITKGSLDFLKAQEDQKRKQSDKALNEQFRTFPRSEEHALRDESNECVFNLNKIYEQEEFNRVQKENDIIQYTVGNFEWKNGLKDTDVEFRPMDNGRFKISWIPNKKDGSLHLKNNVIRKGDKFYPANLNCVRFGCDPFSVKSTHGKGSKGGIHGKTIVAPEGNAPSDDFVVEYLARPQDETIFFEDVIKVIRFYGAPILVESNRIDLLRHMRNRGYRGFAMDRLDRPKEKLNPHEKEYGGQPMSGKDIIDSHINAVGLWIERKVGVNQDESNLTREVGEMGFMPFEETLKDWRKFNPDKRTDHDAFVSSGLAIMACNIHKYQPKREKPKTNYLKELFVKFDNTGLIGQRNNNKKQNGLQ